MKRSKVKGKSEKNGETAESSPNMVPSAVGKARVPFWSSFVSKGPEFSQTVIFCQVLCSLYFTQPALLAAGKVLGASLDLAFSPGSVLQ